MVDLYIAWAQFWCPEPVRERRAPLQAACAAYDEPDRRIGDDAEHDDFLSRVLWLETAIRLARIGWTIEEVEAARWPAGGLRAVEELMREL